MKTKLSKSLLYVYIVPIVLIAGVIIASSITLFFTTTTKDKDGKIISTDWARKYAKDINQYIQYEDGAVTLSKEGEKLLTNQCCWLQIIDESGDEVDQRYRPDDIPVHYSPFDLLLLYQNGSREGTVIVNKIKDSNLVSLIGCPVKVSKVTMYVDKERYDSGKSLIIGSMVITFVLVFGIGIFYCMFTSKHLNRIYRSLEQISQRTYRPIYGASFLHEIYDGLNSLEQNISEAEQIRTKNEAARSEWIANITHDLKTPMAPIKGYAEILSDPEREITGDKAREYGKIIFKNTLYVEQLTNDLKITYQLQNGMLPLNHVKEDFVRFVKELVIDILNMPEYGSRAISFESDAEQIMMLFDAHLLKRAITNIIINALVHNPESTEVRIRITSKGQTVDEKSDGTINLWIEDNGKGMTAEELTHLFDRYYRGTSTDEKPEGTGLGMAIAKQIIEVEHGMITAKSTLSQGTSFQIQFQKIN